MSLPPRADPAQKATWASCVPRGKVCRCRCGFVLVFSRLPSCSGFQFFLSRVPSRWSHCTALPVRQAPGPAGRSLCRAPCTHPADGAELSPRPSLTSNRALAAGPVPLGSAGSGSRFAAGPHQAPRCFTGGPASGVPRSRHRAVRRARAEGTHGLPGSRCQASGRGARRVVSGGTCRGRGLRQLTEDLRSHWPAQAALTHGEGRRKPGLLPAACGDQGCAGLPFARLESLGPVPHSGRTRLKEGGGQRGGSRRRPEPGSRGRRPPLGAQLSA